MQFNDPLGDLFKHPLHKLLDLDKELRNIRSLLEVETSKKVQLEEYIKRGKHKLAEIRDRPKYDGGI